MSTRGKPLSVHNFIEASILKRALHNFMTELDAAKEAPGALISNEDVLVAAEDLFARVEELPFFSGTVTEAKKPGKAKKPGTNQPNA